ncbi:unnamed protein product [Closterium sp. Naga37s-1]|nr:unnamed protein product [Closterium sp. Naga37s-1]
MTDVPNPASPGGDVRPVGRTPTSNPSSTLPLLYDLDALAQIPAGEFTKDIPPAPIGEFTKSRKTSAPTGAGDAGPSSVPDESGDQDEEDYSSASDEDDEDDPRPRCGAGPRTLEEKLRGERAFIEELLDEDELEDLLHTSVPQELWKATDFVEEDMVYACVDVLVMEAMRHLKTIEGKSTLKSYISWIYHYKRWAAKMRAGRRSWPSTAEDLAKKGSDADIAAVHFWRTLQMFRRIVAEDLAVKLVRTPWHPYVQYSKLCRIPLFQHWAKRVEKTDTETIKKRQDPTLIQPEEISLRHDAQYAVVSLKETLKLERERSAVEKIDLEEKIDMRDATIASLTAEITRLTEALHTDEEASYKLNVVQPWRNATNVRDAWRLWTSCTSADTRRLCDRFTEPGFVDRHTLLDGASQGALGMRVRRMMKVIDAMRQLCLGDGEADTEEVVDALNKIAAPGIGTFSDALTVLNADTVATFAGPGKGVKGLSKGQVSKLRVACAFVARGFKLEKWVADLFPNTWEEQMKVTLADMACENDAGQLPPTKKSAKRKKTA